MAIQLSVRDAALLEVHQHRNLASQRCSAVAEDCRDAATVFGRVVPMYASQCRRRRRARCRSRFVRWAILGSKSPPDLSSSEKRRVSCPQVP